MNQYGESWRTYTVGYGSSFSDDELRDAEATASHFASQHAAVTLDRATFRRSSLENIVACLEEPIASSSIVPMYFVCQRARQDVKVALIGQGPGRAFRRVSPSSWRTLWGRLGAAPPWMRAAAAKFIVRLPRNETLKRGVYSLDVPDRLRAISMCCLCFLEPEIDELFQEGCWRPNTGDTIVECWRDLEPTYERNRRTRRPAVPGDPFHAT